MAREPVEQATTLQELENQSSRTIQDAQPLGGIATAVRVAHQPGSQAGAFARLFKQAFVDGWARSMWLSVGVIGALFTYDLVRCPPVSDRDLRAHRRGSS